MRTDFIYASKYENEHRNQKDERTRTERNVHQSVEISECIARHSSWQVLIHVCLERIDERSYVRQSIIPDFQLHSFNEDNVRR